MKNFTKFNKLTVVLMMTIVFQAPSIVPTVKYLGQYGMFIFIVYFICMGVVYTFFVYQPNKFTYIQEFLDRKIIFFIIFIGVFVIQFVLYRHELFLQSIGQGSDAGPGLIVAGQYLFHGKFPYLDLTYLHNPISPGPGWVILAMPFTVTHSYGWMVPVSLLISGFVLIKLTKSVYKANLYLFFLLTSPAFWQEMTIGNDYIIIGIIYGLTIIAIFHAWGSNWWTNTLCVFGVAILATARLNFVYLGLLFGGLLWFRNKRAGIGFAVIALVIAILLHLSFFEWDSHHYAPLHVINEKGGSLFNLTGLISMLIMSFLLLIITYFVEKNSLQSWLLIIYLWLTLPLVLLGIFAWRGDYHWSMDPVALHYAVTYTMITLPIFALWATLRLK